ncbi:hypothetical protein PVAND_009635 [Polypedilum vanderplanki]|uniref:RRM domain-containing protein n=1 Tax=Polypedilum vanderplanki TaxID=319348 RepID=A0A9J6CDV5_POLVA|nr:hypothetical protein PVAND_009635 [Polypedilum vanderplanki]
MENKSGIEYLYKLKKIYFDTYIKIYLKELEYEDCKNRLNDLIKEISKLEIENKDLLQQINQYGNQEKNDESGDESDDDTDYAELNYDDNTSKNSKDSNEQMPLVKNEIQTTKKYSIDLMRLYCYSLKQTTTEETLYKYFSEFGKVVDVSLPLSKNTAFNRTYAFITFANYKKFPLDHEPHIIDGCHVFVSKLNPTNGPQKTDYLLVNGVLNNLNGKDLKNYFSKYGTVLKIRKERPRSQNYKIRFAYIQFASCDSVETAVKQPIHEIKHQIVDIRKVQFRE